MTQEEKAKAYDEALEKARMYRDNAKAVEEYAAVARYENIFPQLCESEDEKIRKEIIDFIQWAEDRGMTRHDYHQAKRPAIWIAYLEKQKELKKEQKPSKWSKKDKKILQSLHHVMNCADAQNAVKRDGLSVEDVCNFLFSIEPNWKPSEEQMKGLKFFLDFHRSQRNAGTTNWREYDAVESLYEQLTSNSRN